MRVIALPAGGAFGGKTPLLEGLACQLARRVGRPVRLLYDRAEEFLTACPAPAADIRLRLGAAADGRLTALEAELVFDCGCRPGSPFGIAALLLGGTYRIPNLDIASREVLTNKPPTGAYRAPGAPQAYFALEVAMDRLARRLGKDPLELRLLNAAREGDPRPDGSRWPRIGLVECLERLLPAWRARSRAAGEGWGIAVGGWPGGTEPAAAICRLLPDGGLAVQVGAVDITGSHAALALIAADAFGLPPAGVRVLLGDTDHAPYGGMAGGSKVVYTVGPAVREAALEARRQALETGAALLEAPVGDVELQGDRVVVRGAPSRSVGLRELAQETMRFGGRHAPISGQGRAAVAQPAPMFTAHLARLRVDAATGEVTPLGYVVAQDVGRAILPPEIAGQVHGGVAQGIGRGLLEEMRYGDGGQPLTTTLMDYLLPTATDVPRVQLELVEVPSALGPHGARGVGEPPVVPVAAALVNAVADATGRELTAVPLRPEDLVG